MTFFTINDLNAAIMAPGLDRRAVYLDKVMLTFVDFEPGVALPLHNHPHEQITLVLEGTLEFTLDGETRILHAGQGVTVASNVFAHRPLPRRPRPRSRRLAPRARRLQVTASMIGAAKAATPSHHCSE